VADDVGRVADLLAVDEERRFAAVRVRDDLHVTVGGASAYQVALRLAGVPGLVGAVPHSEEVLRLRVVRFAQGRLEHADVRRVAAFASAKRRDQPPLVARGRARLDVHRERVARGDRQGGLEE